MVFNELKKSMGNEWKIKKTFKKVDLYLDFELAKGFNPI